MNISSYDTQSRLFLVGVFQLRQWPTGACSDLGPLLDGEPLCGIRDCSANGLELQGSS